jgi:hypothetical protein
VKDPLGKGTLYLGFLWRGTSFKAIFSVPLNSLSRLDKILYRTVWLMELSDLRIRPKIIDNDFMRSHKILAAEFVGTRASLSQTSI